jgi:hypothetical protein
VFASILLILSWLLLPAAIIVIVDDWFLRPRRRLAALPAVAADPAWLRAIYSLLPLLVIGGALRLFRSEQLDFSLVLVIVPPLLRARRRRMCRSPAWWTTHAAWCRWWCSCCCCGLSCSSPSAFPPIR